MKYNLVDQINVKQGGQNYYIKFLEEKIFKEKQVFLVIGLDSKRNNHFITYSMVSSKNTARLPSSSHASCRFCVRLLPLSPAWAI